MPINPQSSGVGGGTDARVDNLEYNLGVNSLRDAVNGGYAYFNMVGGVGDVYTDQTGIDTGAATNATYDAAGNYYAPTPAGAASLLLHMDGTVGSTTFTDATGDHTVTPNGNAKIDGNKFGSSVMSFDGTGDYLTIPDSGEFSFGSGDFTIDCWIRGDGGTFRTIIGKDAANNKEFFLQVSGTGLTMYLSSNGSSWTNTLAAASVITASTWHHVAVVRSGSDLTLYVDGTSVATETDSTDIFNGTAALNIGAHSTQEPWKGNIDEVRILKGTAAWTTAFTPPTVAHTDGSQQLLIHSNTTDGSTTFTDSGSNAHTITANGDAKHASLVKFGQSAFFDGTGDYLELPASSDWDLGTGEFTIDFWYRPSVVSGTPVILDLWNDSGLLIQQVGSGLNLAVDGSFRTIATLGAVVNTWKHIAFVRSGDNFIAFVNGVVTENNTHVGIDMGYTSQILRIGGQKNNTNYINAHIDELRFLKGTAIWTAGFTPPSSAYALAATNMTLPSIDFASGLASASNVRPVMLYEPIDATTLNTDLILEVSRDSGTTWTAATLETYAVFSGAVVILVADEVSLTSQPAGTTVTYRVRTLNAKDIHIQGVYLQWR